MEDSIQLIILVITFAAFIISAIVKPKKKAGSKTGFDKTLEALLGIPTSDPKPVNSESYDDDYAVTPIYEPVKRQPAPQTKNEPQFIEGEDAIPNKTYNIDNENGEPGFEFDARKAIIYAEIINRKYI